MNKDKLYINDVCFSHAKSSSLCVEPEFFEWVRKYDEDYLIFTDYSLNEVDNFNNKKKYAWLLESPEISKFAYDYIKENYNKFNYIFTFDEELLKISDKFILVPIGGCWIEENDRLVHEKTKNISSIVSFKRETSGHKFRHDVFKNFSSIDYFGFMNPIDKKITALKDYRFSIVIENCKKDYYFTEKLIDCFVTGTIPIYWGCPSIGKFFDINGILTFNDINELKIILESLDGEYEKRIESINKNYELSKNYLIADNLVYDIIMNKNL